MPRAHRPDGYQGPRVDTVSRIIRSRAPTPRDYRRPETGAYYELNTLWIDTANNIAYILLDIAANVALWEPVNNVSNNTGWSNIGWSYSSGTLTVHGSNGAALSTSNLAYVTMNSKSSPGTLVRYSITANQTLNDDAHASSELASSTFGTTAGVAWATDMPFFIYAVSNDDEDTITFMISRFSCASVSPSAIRKSGTPAVTESSFFSFEDITVGDYNLNPCMCLGAFRMQKSASDDWTVQALNTRDGPGNYLECKSFVMPAGQNGAATGSYFSNVTTAPIFTNQGVTYWIKKSGFVHASLSAAGLSQAGAGAEDLRVHLPTAAFRTTYYCPGTFVEVNIAVFTTGVLYQRSGTAQKYLQIIDTATSALFQGGDIDGDVVTYSATYRGTDLA